MSEQSYKEIITNESIEEMLREETKNITPNLLSEIKLKAKDIKIENETVEKENKKSSFNFNSWFSPFKIALACIIGLLLVVSVAGVNIYGQAVETITIDVNPSIELSVNRFDRVIEVKYNNDDAENLYEELDLKNVKVDDAVSQCYESLYNAGYLDDIETNMIVVSCYDESGKNEDNNVDTLSHVCDLINQMNEEHQVKSEIKENLVSDEIKEFAEDLGVSVGQVKVIVDILTEDSETTLDDLLDKSMKELKKIYNEARKNNDSKQEDNPSQESSEESDGESNEESTEKSTEESTEEQVDEKTTEELVEEEIQKFKDEITKAVEEGKSYADIIKEKAQEESDKISDYIDYLKEYINNKDSKDNNNNNETDEKDNN